MSVFQTLERRLKNIGYQPVFDPGVMLVSSQTPLKKGDMYGEYLIIGTVTMYPDSKVYNAQEEGPFVGVTFTPFEWARREMPFFLEVRVRRIRGNPQIRFYSKGQGSEIKYAALVETFDGGAIVGFDYYGHDGRPQSIEGMFDKEGNPQDIKARAIDLLFLSPKGRLN